MSKLFAGVLIALAAMAGIYAIAATIATNMATGFTTTEANRHASSVEFAAAMRQTAAEHRASRTKCGNSAAAKMDTCAAEALAGQTRAGHGVDLKPLTRPGVSEPKTAHLVDVALYRAHRQFPD